MKIMLGFIFIIFSFVLYHNPLAQEAHYDDLPSKDKPAFDEFLGVNSVRESTIEMIKDQYQVAKYHRIFAMDAYLFTGEEIVVDRKGNNLKVDLSIPHDEYPDDKIGFNPSKGAGGFNFDEFLLRMKENGLHSIPVLARNLLYTNVPEDNVINVWQLPYDNGGTPEDPMSYKAYSSFLYQFAARYGKNKLKGEGGTIDPAMLKLTDSNEPKAGLDLVYAIEPGNEMDKDWLTDNEEMTPPRMAAFLSAAIDGHMGQMGPGHGIRTADPEMKILFPGPIDIRPDYILAVRDEILKLRANAEALGYPVNPFENFVMTAHIYPFKGGKAQRGEGGEVIENTDIVAKSIEFVAKMKEAFDGCEVYLTEIGYDKVVNAHSQLGTPATHSDPVGSHQISTYSQAKHITRLIMNVFATGYDKMFLFTLKDPAMIGHSGYKVKFNTSGLIRKNGVKDHSWFAVNAMRHRLKDFVFDSSEEQGDLKIIRLKNGDKTAIVTWLTSNSDASWEGYTLDLGDDYDTIKLVELKDDQPLGKETLLAEDSKTVELIVEEFPKIVIAEN